MNLLQEIPPINAGLAKRAQDRWDSLTKPRGSLGRLEDLVVRWVGMTGRPFPALKRKVIFTVAADHGVAAENVSLYPQSVTAQMVAGFIRGKAAINLLARHAGAEVRVVDAGVLGGPLEAPGLISCRVRPGTGNMAKEPAMTRSEAERIVEAGCRIFSEEHEKRPIDLVGLGDMGIGNTTASAALTAVLVGLPVPQVSGRGVGLNDDQLNHKIQIIEKAIALHHPDSEDPLDCLAKVGGLEIGCLAGILLAAAQARVPVVLDGFITTAAALVACRLAPQAAEYLIASHQSVEPGHRILLQALELEPLLNLRMRLGEGTGAALGMTLVEAALNLFTGMPTFAEAGVSDKEK